MRRKVARFQSLSSVYVARYMIIVLTFRRIVYRPGILARFCRVKGCSQKHALRASRRIWCSMGIANGDGSPRQVTHAVCPGGPIEQDVNIHVNYEAPSTEASIRLSLCGLWSAPRCFFSQTRRVLTLAIFEATKSKHLRTAPVLFCGLNHCFVLYHLADSSPLYLFNVQSPENISSLTYSHCTVIQNVVLPRDRIVVQLRFSTQNVTSHNRCQHAASGHQVRSQLLMR